MIHLGTWARIHGWPGSSAYKQYNIGKYLRYVLCTKTEYWNSSSYVANLPVRLVIIIVIISNHHWKFQGCATPQLNISLSTTESVKSRLFPGSYNLHTSLSPFAFRLFFFAIFGIIWVLYIYWLYWHLCVLVSFSHHPWSFSFWYDIYRDCTDIILPVKNKKYKKRKNTQATLPEFGILRGSCSRAPRVV